MPLTSWDDLYRWICNAKPGEQLGFVAVSVKRSAAKASEAPKDSKVTELLDQTFEMLTIGAAQEAVSVDVAERHRESVMALAGALGEALADDLLIENALRIGLVATDFARTGSQRHIQQLLDIIRETVELEHDRENPAPGIELVFDHAAYEQKVQNYPAVQRELEELTAIAEALDGSTEITADFLRQLSA